jgi:hypothetical protein
MLIVVQNGKINLATDGEIPRLVCAQSIVTGNVPDDVFEKKAMVKAGITARAVDNGEI